MSLLWATNLEKCEASVEFKQDTANTPHVTWLVPAKLCLTGKNLQSQKVWQLIVFALFNNKCQDEVFHTWFLFPVPTNFFKESFLVQIPTICILLVTPIFTAVAWIKIKRWLSTETIHMSIPLYLWTPICIFTQSNNSTYSWACSFNSYFVVFLTLFTDCEALYSLWVLQPK